MLGEKTEAKVDEFVIYTGDNSYAPNKFIYNIMKDCLLEGDMFKVKEVGYIHPSHSHPEEQNRKYYKLEGFITAFPCESFIKPKSFVQNKYNLR